MNSMHFFMRTIGISIFLILAYMACSEDMIDEEGTHKNDLTHISYNPEQYILEVPDNFPKMEIPEDNPMTVEGVALGRMLFYDPILSSDSSLSCASCHKQEYAFTDGRAKSIGVIGQEGRRSSMSLVNLGYNYNGLFWDGRSTTLEEQALIPVEDPIELHESWPNVEEKLQKHSAYPARFRKAFGIRDKEEIQKELVAKALAQFQRTIVSYNSLWDRHYRNEDFLSEEAFNGYQMSIDHSGRYLDAECAHCHGEPLFTTNTYANNGIEAVENYDDFPDNGRGEVSGNFRDNGKFRVPTLRNIALTAPYMHDGRFETLEEVLDHYNRGGHHIGNVDPLIGPLGLSEEEKGYLLAFMKALTDSTILTNEAYSNPFE